MYVLIKYSKTGRFEKRAEQVLLDVITKMKVYKVMSEKNTSFSSAISSFFAMYLCTEEICKLLSLK